MIKSQFNFLENLDPMELIPESDPPIQRG